MTRTLIAACGGPLIRRLRKTFPVAPVDTDNPVSRRRGRMLSRGELSIAELPPLTEGETNITGELAFYLGGIPACTAVLLVVPAAHLTLADRITADRRRELIPDLLEPASRLGEAVHVGEIAEPTAWSVSDWAFRRLGPHQFWVLGMPVTEDAAGPHASSAGAIHRGLRSVVAALEEQNR